ncbi:hypothetical protein D3C81_2034250 [compost metagenome]
MTPAWVSPARAADIRLETNTTIKSDVICINTAESIASTFPTISASGLTDISRYSTTRFAFSVTTEEATWELAIIVTIIRKKRIP